MKLDLARAVADAVLYEGYLLYPYRASSSKNQMRWNFGVLGPPGAAESGFGDGSVMSMQCLFAGTGQSAEDGAGLVVHLRFLHLQERQVYDAEERSVEEIVVDSNTVMTWDEAVEEEVTTTIALTELDGGFVTEWEIGGGEEHETLTSRDGTVLGSLVRRRHPLNARMGVSAIEVDGCSRLTVQVDNVRSETTTDTQDAISHSLIGAHLLIEGHGVEFISLLEPPESAREPAAGCEQSRCWPVLTGESGDTDLILGSPIILYDYPEVAGESAGALYDSTEIDEILTLRVMTMTDEEKAEARATDPRAREIIDRCDEMTPEMLAQMHGVLRDPHADLGGRRDEPDEPDWPGVPEAIDMPTLGNPEPLSFDNDVPWWDPVADASVEPGTDEVVVDGVAISKGSLVRVHPKRRADAQDLFFDNQIAEVSAVLFDVDGGVHVALLLVDDPGKDLHDWYGRYFYYDPDEVEPLADQALEDREESRS